MNNIKTHKNLQIIGLSLIFIVLFAFNKDVLADTDENGNIIFTDPILKEAILAQADTDDDGEISATEALAVNCLDLNELGIQNLNGLQEFTNLTHLNLIDNDISDIGYLSGLTHLRDLFLSRNNEIGDISSLSQLTNLCILELHEIGISNISSLSGMSQLRSLHIIGNNITDLSPLANKENLIILYANNNQISDISVLENLPNLEMLGLSENYITDISPISGLDKLTNLMLGDNPINNASTPEAVHQEEMDFEVDGTEYEVWVVPREKNNTLVRLETSEGVITPKFDMCNMVYELIIEDSVNSIDIIAQAAVNEAFIVIKLNGEEVSANDIPLANEGDIIEVEVTAVDGSARSYVIKVKRNNNIVFHDNNLKSALISKGVDVNNDGEISLLEAVGIKELRLESSSIQSIDDLEVFKNLTLLHLEYNSISDISVVENFNNLESLWLSSNTIEDISKLSNLKQMKYLHLNDNLITDISALGDLTQLQSLSIRDNQIQDISSLVNLTNLKRLSLAFNTGISDISVLSNLSNLEELELHNIKTDDISSLENLVNLKILYIFGIGLSDISGLEKLVNLEILYANNNNISDISVLANFPSLKYLGLANNRISDISVLSSLKKLERLYLYSNPINNASTPQAIHKEHLDFTVDGEEYEVWVVEDESNCNLSDLIFSEGAISPFFIPNHSDYILYVDETVSTIDLITYIEVDTSSAIIQLNGVTIPSSNIPINGDEDIIEVLVTAKDQSVRPYRIEVQKVRIENSPIIFNDDFLKSALINKGIDSNKDGEITRIEAYVIQELNLTYTNIQDITGLEYFDNIVTLELSYNNISDVSGLKNLQNLESLRIRDNQIEDISDLSSLTRLNFLSISNNTGITDVSCIGQMTHLIGLEMHNVGTNDISCLTNLVELETLHMIGIGLTDISDLSRLRKLRALYLNNNEIEDITVLSNLKSMEYLGLTNNNISDISALSGLKELKRLYLRDNPINDGNTPEAEHKELLDFIVDGVTYEVWVVEPELSVIVRNYGYSGGSSDMNGDGIVDILDIIMKLKNR